MKDTITTTAVAARDLAVDAVVYHDVHENPITVTYVRHNVAHYTHRVTVVRGTDVHGVLVELICDPDFSFLRPLH